MITGSEEQYCTEWCQWSPAPRDSQVPVPRDTMQQQDQAERNLHPKPWQILCCPLLPSAAPWAGRILSFLWPLATCKSSGPGHPLAPTPFTPKKKKKTPWVRPSLHLKNKVHKDSPQPVWSLLILPVPGLQVTHGSSHFIFVLVLKHGQCAELRVPASTRDSTREVLRQSLSRSVP